MRKKGIKILLTMCMVFSMLFGSVLCVSAEETTTFEKNLEKYFKYANDVYFIGASNLDNIPYKAQKIEFSENVYIGAFKRYVTGVDYDYLDIWAISESPNVKYNSGSANFEEYETAKEYIDTPMDKSYDMASVVVLEGKTYYYVNMTCMLYDDFGWSANLPVYGCTPDEPHIGTLQKFQELLSVNIDMEDVYKPEDFGEYDKALGYLHGLEYNSLITYNEDGVPTEAYYNFTWDKYYEEYDSSYEVEIYGVCNLERKSWFGLGESKITNSERLYIKTVPYVESGQEKGKVEITNTEMNAIFQSFWDVDKSIYETIAWNYDYYFRIVKDGKYGPWTIYDHKYGPMKGDDTGEIYVGEEDEEGNIIKDEDTDYGEGIEIDPSIGGGNSKDDALEDLIEDDDFQVTDISDWFQWLYDTFKSLIDSLGQFPQLIGKVFTFLPEPVIVLLCAVIVIAVVLRIVGR